MHDRRARSTCKKGFPEASGPYVPTPPYRHDSWVGPAVPDIIFMATAECSAKYRRTRAVQSDIAEWPGE
jgi:hypothetical protein